MRIELLNKNCVDVKIAQLIIESLNKDIVVDAGHVVVTDLIYSEPPFWIS